MKRVTLDWQRRLGAGILCLLGAACSASTRPVQAIDCNAAEGYDLSAPLRVFESAEEVWFSGGDPTGSTVAPVVAATANPECGTGGSGGTAGATGASGVGGTTSGGSTGTGFLSVAIEPIEDGGRCGSMNAMVLRSAGHTDWGSLFGDWKLASAPGTAFCDTCGPWDGTGYEGIAIWARSSATTDKTVSVLLDTWQTSASGTTDVDPTLVCKVDCSAGTGTRSIDEAGNVTSQAYVSPPGTCGNGFQRTLTVTAQWQLYFLPFNSFYQELKPNLAPGGVDPSHINGLTLRTAKEAVVELWVDDIAFYRRK
jgi:hypothetical protein